MAETVKDDAPFKTGKNYIVTDQRGVRYRAHGTMHKMETVLVIDGISNEPQDEPQPAAFVLKGRALLSANPQGDETLLVGIRSGCHPSGGAIYRLNVNMCNIHTVHTADPGKTGNPSESRPRQPTLKLVNGGSMPGVS